MGDYKRLISYIYSYEKGLKSKNAGFAKIESRNGVCKVNISLRIADELMNEADDNMLEVFLFSRNDKSIQKIFLDRIRIVNGCSVLKLRMNSDNIGSSNVPIEKLNGIFICSKAFLKNHDNLNIIYASEWDDRPIIVDEFKGMNESDMDDELSDNMNAANKSDTMDTQQSPVNDDNNNNTYDDQNEMKAAELDEPEEEIEDVETSAKVADEDLAVDQKQSVRKSDDKTSDTDSKNEDMNAQTVTESDFDQPTVVELEVNKSNVRKTEPVFNYDQARREENKRLQERFLEQLRINSGLSSDELMKEDIDPSCDNKLVNIMEEEQKKNDQVQKVIDQSGFNTQPMNSQSMNPHSVNSQSVNTQTMNAQAVSRQRTKSPTVADYYRMLRNCYPRVNVCAIKGECIKITPHDISYLPRKYWNLSNNSFMLHGFYSYKYLLLCENVTENGLRYMIGVPGMFHPKEQAMARMYGFTEFELENDSETDNFGYWCMCL